MTYDDFRRQLVLIGGTRAVNDTWLWDGSNWIERFPAPSPPVRTGAAIGYLGPPNKQVVLFGGNVQTPPFVVNDTWVWDGSTWTQQFPTTSPSARVQASFVWDAATRQLVLFGGFTLADPRNPIADTWVWDGSDWAQQFPVTSPPGRFDAPVVFDKARREVVLFGGQGPCNAPTTCPGRVLFNDTWVYG